MTANSRGVTGVGGLLVLSAFLAFAGLASDGVLGRPAQAAPPSTGTCSITYYYSDPEKTKQVGTFSNCPNPPPKRGLTGRKTRYYDVETVNLGNPSPPRPRPPGHLPCEFLAKGCGNLPTEHH